MRFSGRLCARSSFDHWRGPPAPRPAVAHPSAFPLAGLDEATLKEVVEINRALRSLSEYCLSKARFE